MDNFIVDLYALAEPCQYGNLREEMIRDQIVVGIRDGRLAEKLQLDAALTPKRSGEEAAEHSPRRECRATCRSK